MPTEILTSAPSLSLPAKSERRSLCEAIESNPKIAFAALSIVYFAAVFTLSSLKLLWLDELITLHIARLNSAHAIWRALVSGADPNPPLPHLAAMVCRRLLGEHAWALRLPAAIGFWAALLGLFLFLKRRVSVAWALAGAVLTMGMGAFEWSFESRSYALFYGFAMLAFYFWTITTDLLAGPGRRRAATAGLAVCLAGGICSNFFAVLAFFPIAAAELTRSLLVRKVRWSIWAALALAGAPLFFFRPIIQTSISLYSPYAWNKVSVQAMTDGYNVIVDWMSYPLCGLTLLAMTVHLLRQLDPVSIGRLVPRRLRRLAAVPSPTDPLLSLPEAVAVSVFVAYPVLGYAVASMHGGMLSPRFVLPVVLGCAIAGILFAHRIFGHLRRAGLAALVLSLLWFSVRSAHSGYVYSVRKQSFDRLMAHIPPPDYPGQPLAISDILMVLPLEYYASPSVVNRMVYPVDFPAIMRYRGEASGEINLWSGRDTVYQFPIVPLDQLQQHTSTYIILTSGQEWLVEDLRRHWYDVQPIDIETNYADTYFFFSAVSRGRPVFFRATGDGDPHPYSEPLPFDADSMLPQRGGDRQ